MADVVPSPLDALLSVTEQLWEQHAKTTTSTPACNQESDSISDKSSICTETSFESSIDAPETKQAPSIMIAAPHTRRSELLVNEVQNVTASNGRQPSGKPKRPLSAYNLFFRHERAKIVGIPVGSSPANNGKKRRHVTSHGKIGFSELGRLIGKRWKQLDPVELQYFETLAAKEKRVYEVKLREYHRRQKSE
eukprot:CAMPEP_0196815416 /NCGR_PEP_ID=MMETSP1362-20130617/49637_1 /TAXON_ID=163516 /ORGANISM="Leptocylindrus danicus, Strain CCMP1856" /LENGTH=191 /DNA_ID=CAMNT_0042192361 /DNA_START=61 /DNA_END=636 /DNA_ORIENTATION=-